MHKNKCLPNQKNNFKRLVITRLSFIAIKAAKKKLVQEQVHYKKERNIFIHKMAQPLNQLLKPNLFNFFISSGPCHDISDQRRYHSTWDMSLSFKSYSLCLSFYFFSDFRITYQKVLNSVARFPKIERCTVEIKAILSTQK